MDLGFVCIRHFELNISRSKGTIAPTAFLTLKEVWVEKKFAVQCGHTRSPACQLFGMPAFRHACAGTSRDTVTRGPQSFFMAFAGIPAVGHGWVPACRRAGMPACPHSEV